ncbi:MAG: magnesium transporter [Lentimicrobium sp.]|jgi:magnesium transporter|nr:magnesium transporter [Lentimicrobium sp.]MDD2528206.1 magnesium transporter [Lentimicrobiaceae bacterium]MDD4596890.1 magnesium transporter [Lentimicrobiaceae bacterium]MDY0025802.1 magnesium transporter [Lentimicrobium sp.]HAH56784.1 magnesium transporter [Bacteroidales bacterium]
MVEANIDFEELIEQRNWSALRREIKVLKSHDIAEIIEELSDDNDIILFRLLPREEAKNTFQYLSFEKQEQIIEGLAKNANRVSSLLNDLDPDDRTAFFEELPGKITKRLLQLLSPEERSIATKLLGYPENSIGRLMTPEFVAVKPEYTVAEALEHIREYGRDSETLNLIYVVDEHWKLIDDIRIREIILARPDQLIKDLMDEHFVSLNAHDDQEVAIRVFQDQDRIALPVIDSEGLLIGIVTVDDVMDVVEEETTEDFHKFGSVQGAIINPLKAGIGFLYKKRIVWLFALVFMNVFSGAALASFENVIKSAVALIFFLPLLIGSGGNAGAQSATLMIRSLATGDVEMRDWFRLIGKELLVSLLLGLTMAVGVSLIASLRAPEIIFIVASTMVLTVIAGSMVGLLLPFIFTRIKIDPASASAPLVTSIADITGVVIYFSIASWYFGIT